MVIMAIFCHIYHYDLVQYGCNYGHYGYLWKDISKCRSPVKTVLKKMDSVRSYSQNKKLYRFLSDFLCKIGQNSNRLAARPVMKKIHFYLISCLIITLVTRIQIAKFCSEKVVILDHPTSHLQLRLITHHQFSTGTTLITCLLRKR